MTVDVRKFTNLLVQRGIYLNEFIKPEGPHAHGAQTTDVAGLI